MITPERLASIKNMVSTWDTGYSASMEAVNDLVEEVDRLNGVIDSLVVELDLCKSISNFREYEN